MVKIIMNVIKSLYNQVNTYLRIKSDIFYLKMAYKEILFSICFTSKKKYFDILHKEGLILSQIISL